MNQDNDDEKTGTYGDGTSYGDGTRYHDEPDPPLEAPAKEPS